MALPPHELVSTGSGYDMKLSFGTPRIVDTVVAGDTFSVVHVNGCGIEGIPGQAATPVARFDLAVSGPVEISVSKEIAETLSLSHPLLPAQISYGGNNTVIRPFAVDRDWYHSDGVPKATATVEKRYSIGNIQAGYFAVRPVTYNPSTGTLIVRTAVTASISTSKMIPSCTGGGQSSRIAQSLFLNMKSSAGYVPETPLSCAVEKYLIITADRYTSNADLARFVEFRKKSFDVKVVTAGSVGTTAGEFAAYIKTEAPSYVLLVGQMTDFPTTTYWSYYGYWGSAKSYLSYVDNGTGRPAIPLGLFFFRTDEALKNIVDKTIYTAQNPNKYSSDLVCFSGNNMVDASLPADHIDRLFDRLDAAYWKPMKFTTTKVYACGPPNQNDAATVVNAMNLSLIHI